MKRPFIVFLVWGFDMAQLDNRPMPRRSIKHYQDVMRYLVRRHGSMTKAVEAIGISDHAYARLMRDDELVLSVAKKIMAGYSALSAINKTTEAA